MRSLSTSLALLLTATVCFGQAFTLRRPYVAPSGVVVPPPYLLYEVSGLDHTDHGQLVTNWADHGTANLKLTLESGTGGCSVDTNLFTGLQCSALYDYTNRMVLPQPFTIVMAIGFTDPPVSNQVSAITLIPVALPISTNRFIYFHDPQELVFDSSPSSITGRVERIMGNWVFSVVADGANSFFRTNGSLCASGTLTSGITNLCIGGGTGGGAVAYEKIFEIRCYNAALTTNQLAVVEGDMMSRFMPYNPAVTGWLTRLLKNGGTYPSTNTINALNTFAVGLGTNGLMSKIDDACCFVPDSLTAGITPFLLYLGSTIWTNVNFVAGDLTTNGLNGDYTSKYLKTGILPRSFYYTNMAATCYAHDFVTNQSISLFGSATSDGTANLQVNPGVAFASRKISCDWPIGTASATRINVTNTTLGCFTVVTDNAAHRVLYLSSSSLGFTSLGTNTTSSPDKISGNAIQFYVLAHNGNGTADQFWGGNISFMAFHHAINVAEAQTFYNLIQNLRVALGGGYL